MRYRSLVGITAAALSLALSSQAAAQSAPPRSLQQLPGGAESTPEKNLRLAPEAATKAAAYKWEAGFLVLSAIDAAQTISCLNRNRCTEGNPIWGRHPSTGKVIAAKLGLGLVHLGIFKLIADRDPHTALRAAQVSAAIQGGFVVLNAHVAF
jgi:hypothetical protein